ncbi:MAG: hypothetical protein AMXMBFR23_28380 [Chloroflexota bacterium]
MISADRKRRFVYGATCVSPTPHRPPQRAEGDVVDKHPALCDVFLTTALAALSRETASVKHTDRTYLQDAVDVARKVLSVEPEAALTQIRKTAERSMRLALSEHDAGDWSRSAFNELFVELNKRRLLPLRIKLHLENIQRWGNAATHGHFEDETLWGKVSRDDVDLPLASLVLVVEWLLAEGTRDFATPGDSAATIGDTAAPAEVPEPRLENLAAGTPPLIRWPLDGRVMAWVPAGAGGFYVDRDPVTARDWSTFLSRRPGELFWEDPWEGVAGSGEFPASGLNSDDALTYAAAHGKNLPTLLQWRQAAAGGVDPVPNYPWGRAFVASRCNHGDVRRRFAPTPVSRFPPQNLIGLRDIVGNFYELVRIGDGTWGVCGGDYRQPEGQLCISADPVPFVAQARTISFRCVATLDDLSVLLTTQIWPSIVSRDCATTPTSPRRQRGG